MLYDYFLDSYNKGYVKRDTPESVILEFLAPATLKEDVDIEQIGKDLVVKSKISNENFKFYELNLKLDISGINVKSIDAKLDSGILELKLNKDVKEKIKINII